MTGTEKIIAHIEADAAAKAESILSNASRQCDAIKANYEEKASALYSEKIRDGVQACQKGDILFRRQRYDFLLRQFEALSHHFLLYGKGTFPRFHA